VIGKYLIKPLNYYISQCVNGQVSKPVRESISPSKSISE
jgi:hypothetical protein